MTFTVLSSGAVLGGLLALAAGLFLLQRLRVRYRPLTVETTLFWREALEEARARVLTQRFRHPWAYLLILATLAAIFLGMAGPEFSSSRDRRHLLLIDGSLAASNPARFASLVTLAEDQVRALPSATRRVVLCADHPRTLLAPGENPLLLRRRLADFAPVAGRAPFEAAIATELELEGRASLEIVLIGDAELEGGFAALMPVGTVLRRLRPEPGAPAPELITLGQGPAASGRYDRIDLLVRLGRDETPPAALECRVDGQVVDARRRVVELPAERRIIIEDLPARGGVAEVGISGRPLGRLALLDRRPIGVALEEGLAPALRHAVAVDPGLLLDAEQADVVLRRSGSTFGGALPAIEVATADEQDSAFHFRHDGERDAAAVLGDLVDRLGLARLDGESLAERLGSDVSVKVSEGAGRRLSMWEDLLSVDRGFVATAEFPLFVSATLRWLAGREEAADRVAVGEPLAVAGDLVETADGRVTRVLGDDFVPASVGSYRDQAGLEVEASLERPVRAEGAAEIATSTEAAGGGPGALEILLILALALLGIEWFLVKTGRIP